MSSTSVPETTNPPDDPVNHVPTRQKRWKRRLVIASAVVLIIVIAGLLAYNLLLPRVTPLALPKLPGSLSADQLGLGQWQNYQQALPANPLTDQALPASPQATPELALLEDAAGQALISQGNLTRGLAYLQAAALAVPDNLRYGNDYRLALRDHKLFQDEQTFFTNLSKKVTSANVMIEYALSYVDMMRSCEPPPDGLVCQAQFSYSSITILDGVLSQNPYNIIARYARGLNHLYWPTLMRHLPMAQQDLQYSVALSNIQKSISTAFMPEAYVALGDVFGKNGDSKSARNIWLNGLQATPSQNQTLLNQRLAIPQEKINDQENGPLRGLGVYVDTDLALFWRKG